MTDEELNQRLNRFSETANSAHEVLRGVLDALAVLGETTGRATADPDEISGDDERAEWRQEADEVSSESRMLLENAASVLEQTADDIRAVAGEDSTGEDSTGEDSTGEDSTGEDSTGEDSTGEDSTGEDDTDDDAASEEEAAQEESADESA